MKTQSDLHFFQSVRPDGRRHGHVHRRGEGHPQLHSAKLDTSQVLSRLNTVVSDGTNVDQWRGRTSRWHLSSRARCSFPSAVQTEPSELPGLVAGGNVKDIASNPTYTFSKPIIAPATARCSSQTRRPARSLTRRRSASFFGVVQVDIHRHRRCSELRDWHRHYQCRTDDPPDERRPDRGRGRDASHPFGRSAPGQRIAAPNGLNLRSAAWVTRRTAAC